MKPFPEAVQAAFPCAAGCVPDRPWWRYAVWPCQTRLIPDLEAGSNKQYRAEDADDAAEADAKYPLPHPGYRAGQIWATENGSSVALMSVTNKSAWICRDLQGITPVFLNSLASLYPYLVADPACPHLAPWSPVGEK